MFDLLFVIIIIFIFTYGLGSLIKYFLIKNKFIYNISFGEIGILGFYFILIISLFFHFFISLNIYFIFFIFFISFILIFYFKSYIKIKINNKIIFIFLLLFLPLIITNSSHPDFEWYHLPYINYLHNFKIIFGLGNVNDFLAFSQTWNDITGLFPPYVSKQGNNVISAFFVFYIIIYFLEEIINKNNNLNKIFLIFILIYSAFKFTDVNEFGGHVPPTFLGFLLNYYLIKFLLEKEEIKKELIPKILIFFSFILLLRINYIILLPIILFLAIFYKNIFLNFILNKKILFLIFFIPLIFISKNFILSGCFVYPISQTCVSSETASWSVGKEYSNERYSQIKASVRGWNYHVLIDGNIENRIDYNIPLKNNLILNHKEYLDKGILFWQKYWLKSGDVIKILNSFIILVFIGLIFFLTNMKNSFKIKNFPYFKVSFLIFFSQLILWIYLTPQSIYGGNTVITTFISFIIAYFLNNINLKKFSTKITFLFFISISLGYFEYKNYYRIYNEFLYSNISNNFSPLISLDEALLDRDYYKFQISDFKINVKKSMNNDKLGLPDECGTVPMICIPEERKFCVSKINKKNSYFIISGNHTYCIDHIKKMMFY